MWVPVAHEQEEWDHRRPRLRCCARVDGASHSARRPCRISRRRGRDRAAHAAHDAAGERRRRGGRTPGPWPGQPSDAAARRPRDLRGRARRDGCVPARRLWHEHADVAWRADRSRADNGRGRAGRPLRPAPDREARRPDRGGRDRRALRRRGQAHHAAVHRRARLSQSGRDRRRPGADRDRAGRDDERRQPLRRRRRPRGGGVRDHRRHARDHRVRPRSRRARRARGAHGRRRARLPDPQLSRPPPASWATAAPTCSGC